MIVISHESELSTTFIKWLTCGIIRTLIGRDGSDMSEPSHFISLTYNKVLKCLCRPIDWVRFGFYLYKQSVSKKDKARSHSQSFCLKLTNVPIVSD